MQESKKQSKYIILLLIDSIQEKNPLDLDA